MNEQSELETLKERLTTLHAACADAQRVIHAAVDARTALLAAADTKSITKLTECSSRKIAAEENRGLLLREIEEVESQIQAVRIHEAENAKATGEAAERDLRNSGYTQLVTLFVSIGAVLESMGLCLANPADNPNEFLNGVARALRGAVPVLKASHAKALLAAYCEIDWRQLREPMSKAREQQHLAGAALRELKAAQHERVGIASAEEPTPAA